jgi:hypothetical protein
MYIFAQYIHTMAKSIAKKELESLLKIRSTIFVDDKIKGAIYLSWRTLKPFQGNLKTLTPLSEKKPLLLC